MKLTENDKYTIPRAMLDEIVRFESGEYIVNDDRAIIVRIDGRYKCLVEDINDFPKFARKFGINGLVCILCAPINTPKIIGFEANAVKTYAYTDPMPPAVNLPDGVEIKRLAPTLAQTVKDRYHNPGDYSVQTIAELMRDKGIFGAIKGGRLAGFIGRHPEGDMGMLEVYEQFRRQGIGSALERFLINFIMTFGRMPVCDVYLDNEPSINLQQNIGMTAAPDYTFWGEYDNR